MNWTLIPLGLSFIYSKYTKRWRILSACCLKDGTGGFFFPRFQCHPNFLLRWNLETLILLLTFWSRKGRWHLIAICFFKNAFWVVEIVFVWPINLKNIFEHQLLFSQYISQNYFFCSIFLKITFRLKLLFSVKLSKTFFFPSKHGIIMFWIAFILCIHGKTQGFQFFFGNLSQHKR